MTLHRKTILFLVCLSLLMFSAFYMTSRMIVMSGFQNVELKNSEENVQFTLHTLVQEAKNIGAVLSSMPPASIIKIDAVGRLSNCRNFGMSLRQASIK